MKSFADTDATFAAQPARLGARLARVDTSRGREEMYHDQLPELLRALASQTRIESITASSAIEDVIVDAERAEKIVEAAEMPKLRDRDEEEFAGYRDAIDEIVRSEQPERMSVPLILHVHRQLFKHTVVRGGAWKREENFIGDRGRADSSVQKLFTPLSPRQTPFAVKELVERYNAAVDAESAHPLILIGAFILDFLAIHPFDDGNGRVARILTTQMLLERGYGVSRYVSVERQILESKNAYYDVLYQSQRGWHEGEHMVWPWVSYLVETLADSYDTFKQRVAALRGLETMSKQDQVRAWALEHGPPTFRLRTARRALPGVSDPTIKLVLHALKKEGLLVSDSKGPKATWSRVVSTIGAPATT